jgi:two-component system phosphate regulon sensor histidine kinase PhoR
MLDRLKEATAKALASARDRLPAIAPTPPLTIQGFALSRPPEMSSGMASIVDVLPDAALLLDTSLRLVHANNLARDLFVSLRPGEHISMTSRNPDLIAAVTEAATSRRRILFELHVRGPIERRLEGAATTLTGAKSDDAPDLLVVLQDLSERDAVARMRVEFVANASHELRTPLASLSGFIETLRGPAKDDPAAREKFLAIMAEQAARMSSLIDDLLLLSRLEMRAHLPPTAIVDLNLVMSDAIRPLAGIAEGSKATITCLARKPSPRVRGDHDELVQAVQNLAQNALKYGRKGGTVTLSVTAGANGRNGTASINVADDGPGIAAEHLPRLTERFYRVSNAASRDKGGTGLGLAIVKHIASRHLGRLEITSAIGQGSTFSLQLPLADEN